MYTSCSYERFFGDVGQLVYTTGSWLISPLSCIRFDNFYDSTLGVGPVLRNCGLAIEIPPLLCLSLSRETTVVIRGVKQECNCFVGHSAEPKPLTCSSLANGPWTCPRVYRLADMFSRMKIKRIARRHQRGLPYD